MTQEQAGFHPVAPRLYVAVWAALVVLTCTTVTVSFLDMQPFAIFTSMLIATAKAGLVMLYFMHIRFERPLFPVLILIVLFTYAVLVFLTFSDYSFR